MIKAAKEKIDLDVQRQARLFAVIFNANGGIDGKPVKVEDILQEQKPISQDQYCEGWKDWVSKCTNGA
jgi:hypothetical protein